MISHFTKTPDASTADVHQVGTINIEPKRLVDVFGQPGESDGYKVSGEYRFTDQAGRVFTIYDWKATSLWFDDDYMDAIDEDDRWIPDSPAEFWANREPVEFHVGTNSQEGVNDFKQWLAETTNEWVR